MMEMRPVLGYEQRYVGTVARKAIKGVDVRNSDRDRCAGDAHRKVVLKAIGGAT